MENEKLIHCEACNNLISREALTCPHCGQPTQKSIIETKKKQEDSAVAITTIISVVVMLIGTVLLCKSLLTFIGDINEYNRYGFGGYNYHSPLTDHEESVLFQMFLGLALDLGGSIDLLILSRKNKAKNSYAPKADSMISKYLNSKTGGNTENMPKWVCDCGKLNDYYTKTCSCGREKPL